MKMKEQCKQSVATALGKDRLNQQEAQKIEQRIYDAMKSIAHEDIDKWRNLSENERITEAGKRVAIDIKADLARKKQILANDILTQNKNIALLDHDRLSSMDVVDRLVAPHGDMSGVQSLDTKARATASIYKGELVDYYTNAKGALGVFTDKKLNEDIVKERFGKDSGNPLAKKISDKMGDVFEKMRQRFNRSGGNIGKLENWGIPQIHDAGKMTQVGKEAWVNQTMDLIDRNKYVKEDGQLYSNEELKNLLNNAFDTITSDGANKIEIGKTAIGGGTSKVTNKNAESRVLHFKNADAWLDYQGNFGGMPLVDIIDAHIAGLSKDIALVENLGSNPKNAMRILMDAAKKKDFEKGLESEATETKRKRAETMFNELVGGNTPQSEVLANIGLGYRSLNVASMLGGTTISSIADQATIAKTAWVHGLAYRKAFGELLTQINPANKQDRELAHSLGLATEEMLGSVARWADDGLTSTHGKAEKFARVSSGLANQVMRISGLNALTAASKVGFSKLLMEKYGRLSRTKDWNALDANDRELLQNTGLNERAWQVFQLAEPVKDRKGNQLMSAQSIYQIPDDVLLKTMDKDVKTLMDGINNQLDILNQRNLQDDQYLANRMQKTEDTKKQISDRLLKYASRKDIQSQNEKQYLQDRIDLLDAQKEAAAAQADMNTYLRTVKNQENFKGFMDDITQGKTIDRLTDKATKLGKSLERLDQKVVQKQKDINEKISTFDKEIQAKYKQFNELLDNKTKQFSEEKLKGYEDALSNRLNTYASRRDVKTSRDLDMLNELKDLVALRQDQATTRFDIQKAVEQTRIKAKTDQKIDQSIISNTKKDYKSGENIGKRLGSSERRIVELREKMRKADREADKAVKTKFKELDDRVNKMDQDFIEYQNKVKDRQDRRSYMMDKITNGIDDNKKALAQKIREEVATQLQAHLLDEQGMAVIEGGLRERTWMSAGQQKGTVMGEIIKGLLQFKTFSAAFLMRHGSRTMSQPTLQGKAIYGASLGAMMTILGGLVVQLKELSNGNNPQEVWDSNDPKAALKFLSKSVIAGGGMPVLGDILAAGTDPTGRDTSSFLVGPLGSDFVTALGATVGNTNQWYEGKDTNAANEVFKAVKNKIPGQNLWYTKLVTNRLLFDNFQDMIAPGYREKVQRKAERQQHRTSWWKNDLDVNAPDFSNVVQ